jgi:molecular chaperone DnaK (HSP70)
VFQNKSEEEATSSAFTNVVISHLYQAYTLTYNLRYREFVNVVSSLLGWGLTPGDIEKTEIQSKLAYQEHIQKCENIIYPIYDALIKAKARTGSIPKVDVVLINGGLSKLPIIRSRLREFFGRQVPIIEVPSPDLSVARGASLYHYNFVNGLDRSSNLLPEGISLEVSQGEFVLLIPANTQYPTTKPIIPQGFQLIIPEAGIPFINIPLWRGEPPHPSAKLIDRKIDLQDQAAYLQKGDIVDIHLTIDTNRQLRLDAWLHRNPNVRFSVTTQYR